MHWTTAKNAAAIEQAMVFASSKGAGVCGFSELAVTGFHRGIAREARPEVVEPAIDSIAGHAARLALAVAVGAPTFADDGSKYNAHLLIDEHGAAVAEVRKQGLTDPEATFFARGCTRPVARLQGLRCSAVICREVSDLDSIRAALPPGTVDLIFVPGALRQDPEKPLSDPPAYVQDIQRLAAATRAHVVHTNWPNALNRPEESMDAGGSAVVSPEGELLFRLPMRASGIGLFALGDRHFEWYPQ